MMYKTKCLSTFKQKTVFLSLMLLFGLYPHAHANGNNEKDVTLDPSHTRPTIQLTTPIQWVRGIHLSFEEEELVGADHPIILEVSFNTKGKVKHIQCLQSTGNEKLDQKAIRAVRNSKARTHYENGIAQPFYIKQVIKFSH